MYSGDRTVSSYTIDSTLDNLFILASDIESRNGLDKFNEYTVQKGDNLYNIAREYQVDAKTLQLVNGLESDEFIYTGQKLLVPKSNIGAYMVSDNETLNGIAKKMGINAEELVQSNETIYLLPEQLLFFKKGKIS